MAFLYKATVVLGVAMYLGVVLFSRPFIAVFTPEDAELIDFTHRQAAVYFSGFVFAGISILTITYLQSIQKAGPAFVLSLLRSVIFVPLFLFGFPVFLGAGSIWYALSVAEFAAFVAAVVLYRRVSQEAEASRVGEGEAGTPLRV